jgi:hypothetical protein
MIRIAVRVSRTPSGMSKSEALSPRGVSVPISTCLQCPPNTSLTQYQQVVRKRHTRIISNREGAARAAFAPAEYTKRKVPKFSQWNSLNNRGRQNRNQEESECYEQHHRKGCCWTHSHDGDSWAASDVLRRRERYPIARTNPVAVCSREIEGPLSRHRKLERYTKNRVGLVVVVMSVSKVATGCLRLVSSGPPVSVAQQNNPKIACSERRCVPRRRSGVGCEKRRSRYR